MKRVTLALAVCFSLGVAAPVRAEDAKALYTSKCASCHGPDGKGQTAMGKKLGARDITALPASEAEIAKAIEEGKPPKMLAYKGKLTPEQIKALASYVKGGLK
jgi:cbb3-type cytochrome c oxidase subunit III